MFHTESLKLSNWLQNSWVAIIGGSALALISIIFGGIETSIFLVAALFFLFAWHYPILFLSITAFFVPMPVLGWLYHNFKLSVWELLLGVITCVWIARGIVLKKPLIKTNKLNTPALLFIALVFVTIILKPPSDMELEMHTESVKVFYMYLKCILVYFIFSHFIEETRQLKHIFIAIALSSVVSLIIAIIQQVFNPNFLLNVPTLFNVRVTNLMSLNSGVARPSALSEHPVNLAYFFSLLFLLIFSHVSIKERSFKFGNWLYMMMLLGGIMITGSRGVWLSLAFTLLLSLVILKIRKTHFFLLFIILWVLMLLVIFYNYHDSNSNPIVSRITSITDPDDTSRGIRIKIAETAWKMFLSNPIFGVGATNFQKYVNEYSSNFGFDWFEMLPWGPEAHNVYLQIASTMGIIGLLGLGFIIQKGFVCARKLACLGEVVLFRAIGLGAILIIVNTMILGLTCNFFLEPLGSLFFLFLALIGRSLVLSQRKQQA